MFETIYARKQQKQSKTMLIYNNSSKYSVIVRRVFTSKIGLFQLHPSGEAPEGMNIRLKCTVEYSYSFKKCCEIHRNAYDFRVFMSHQFDILINFIMIFKRY